MSLMPNDLLIFESVIRLTSGEKVTVRLDKFKKALDSALISVTDRNPLKSTYDARSKQVTLVSSQTNTSTNYAIVLEVVGACLVKPKTVDDFFPYQLFEIHKALESLYETRTNLLDEYAFRRIGMSQENVRKLKSLAKRHTQSTKDYPNLSKEYYALSQAAALGIKPSDIETYSEEDRCFTLAVSQASTFLTLIQQDQIKRAQEVESKKNGIMSSGKLPTFSGGGR